MTLDLTQKGSIFGFCGVSVLIPPLILCLVTQVQNDSKAKASVGAGVEGEGCGWSLPSSTCTKEGFLSSSLCFLNSYRH